MITTTSLSDEINLRAASYSNQALAACPGSVERQMFERLAEECREIADFIRLRAESQRNHHVR